MAGCRSLTDSEVNQVLAVLGNQRDKTLFILGLRTGFRISELLSLTVADVFHVGSNQCLDRIKVQKRSMKGKTKSREVVLHPQAKEAIQLLVGSNPPGTGESYLFQSRNGGNQAISRFQAHKVLKSAYAAVGLTGTVATHSMRKSFAKKVYTNLKFDLLATKDALGHSSITNTVKYLETNQSAIDQAVLAA